VAIVRTRRRNAERVECYITRWSNRAQHPHYLRTLAEADKWNGCLVVAVNGNGPLDDELVTADRRGHVRILDCRKQLPDGSFPKLCKACYEDGIARGLYSIGLMDDDALVLDPPAMLEAARVGTREHNAGAQGPITQYMHMARHQSRLDVNYWPVYHKYWSTGGSQYYGGAMLHDTYEWWQHLLSNAAWRMDFPMFMLAHAADYAVCEFWVEGYRHRTSQASDNKGDNPHGEQWYSRRLSQMRVDYQVIADTLRMTGKYDFYRPIYERIAQEEVRYVGEKAKQSHGWAKWRTRILTKFSELEVDY
jgi:hypothetical protein